MRIARAAGSECGNALPGKLDAVVETQSSRPRMCHLKRDLGVPGLMVVELPIAGEQTEVCCQIGHILSPPRSMRESTSIGEQLRDRPPPIAPTYLGDLTIPNHAIRSP